MKKLQRYRTNNAPAVADPDGCWVADYAATELEATNAELYDDLKIAVGVIKELCHYGELPLPKTSLIRFEKALSTARGDSHDT